MWNLGRREEEELDALLGMQTAPPNFATTLTNACDLS